ncbi:MAG: Hsp70 family protein [Planctomycetes bacterium]|nr:Hsp70 family protein [Planctomycetota bacterium]
MTEKCSNCGNPRYKYFTRCTFCGCEYPSSPPPLGWWEIVPLRPKPKLQSLKPNTVIIGIDFGAINSCAAVMKDGIATIIPDAEGIRTTPSIVATAKNGEKLVGQVAKRQALTNPENTIFNIKRLMGRKFKELSVDRDKAILTYHIVECPNGEAGLKMGDSDYSAPEVSSMIFKKLKADAEAYLGEPVIQAVITVPAYFNNSQKQAVKDAGTIAGFKVLQISNEPIAVAMAHELSNGTIAVYNLSNTTFNISILDTKEGAFRVNSTNGDTHLGGDDINQRIIEWLCEEFMQDQGIDLKQNKMALQRLEYVAEKAKCELSFISQTEVDLPFITTDSTGPKHLNIVLDRTKLEELVGDIVSKTISICRQIIKEAGVEASQIDEIVLAGGQTRMPFIQQRVKDFFGKEPCKGIDPCEAIALGAAIQAGAFQEEAGEYPKE